jgi:spore germination protein KB
VLILVAVICLIRCGVSVIGKCAEMLFPFVLFLFIVGFSALIPLMQIANIKPMLEFGAKPLLHSGIQLLAFPYLEAVLFLFFAHHLPSPQKWKKAVLHSALLSGTLFFIVTFLVITTLSASVTADLTYPSYFVIRTISFADFYERFEILISVLWYITIFFRMTFFLFVTVSGLNGFFGMKDSTSLLIPLALIGLVLSKLLFPNYVSVIQAFDTWQFYVMLFGLVFPAVVYVIGVWRGRRGKTPGGATMR